jgi:molybdopterin molybdotransferase
MISVTEALQHINNHCTPSKVAKKPIKKVMGMVLAADVLSPINMPPFKQSAMDGYAFEYSDDTTYMVVGEVQAGSSENIKLGRGEAVRIFTGARVPNDADTVVMQEHVTRADGCIEIKILPKPKANVRPLGEQITKGAIALEKGTTLNEAGVGFLAGLGIAKVDVYQTPKVSVLITGDELQKVGKELEEGQVYDSNSLTLQLALKRLGITEVRVSKVKDDLRSTTKAIEKHLKKSDVVLISGGISVGDYDFVQQALMDNNAKEVFYKVNQKPGKPLWFGYKGNTKIFALPGNPASSLICFYVYVWPLLKAQMGYQEFHLPRLRAKAKTAIKNSYDKTIFLKGNVSNGNVSVLTGQASSMLKSLAVSNALLIVPSNIEEINKGEYITYIQL